MQTRTLTLANGSRIMRGSRIAYRPNFGTGDLVEGYVAFLDTDIKNGRPGIDIAANEADALEGNGGSWCYLSAVELRLVKDGTPFAWHLAFAA